MSKLSLPLTFHVTQADIDEDSHGCSTCPVARAIERVTGFRAIVRDHLIFAGEWQDGFMSPRSVADFVYNFDKRRPVQPFSFTLTTANLI